MASKKKDAALFVKCSEQFHADMHEAVKRENEMLGNYEERTVSEVIRGLCDEYIKRIEAIAASEVAQHAAKVLKRGKKAVRA